jgi:two-component system chemotaxis sensor kinase CheA
MDQKQLFDIFLSEADELIQTIEKDLVALDSSPGDASLIDELFRAVHTMKSSAAMVGFEKTSEYAHLLENLLERLRNNTMGATKELISFLLSCGDFLKGMLENAAQGREECDPDEFNKMKGALNQHLSLHAEDTPQSGIKEREVLPASKKIFHYEISMTFQKNVFLSGNDPLLLLLELQELGGVVRIEPNLSNLPGIHEISPCDLYISWEILFKTEHSITDIEAVFIFVREENNIKIEDVSDRFDEGSGVGDADKLIEELQIAEEMKSEQQPKETLKEQKKTTAPLRQSTVRVRTEKLDRLVNLTEELTIGLGGLFILLEKSAIRSGKIQEKLEHLIAVGRETQEQVMMTRMFPLEATFGRFQRMIRDLAVSQNKPISVTISGADTELDKNMVEKIEDPLKHIIRNCVDHGIESPEERKTKGKPEEGVVSLKAYQKEGRIYIEIGDDGRGLDEHRVLKKAISRNFISEGSTPTKEELYNFLFLPGFSTKDEVSEISGRGVGLDVVQTNVSELGGTINIVSEKDKGTTFIINIPMTLAIIKAMQIRVGKESFLVPFSVIAGLAHPLPGDIKTIETKEELINFQGEYIPLIRLEEVFKIEDPGEEKSIGIVIIVESERKRFGIFAYDIVDEQQVVIKTLETNFRKVPGIAGGTILGDGQVSLIIDIYGLEKMFFKKGDKAGIVGKLSQDNQEESRIFEG